MDAKLNQLPKIDDFRRAYILAQYPHENGYRAATYEEFYNWINLRLELSGVEMAPVQGGVSEETATLIPPGPVGQQRKMDASPGWYSVNGAPIEAEAGKVWKFFWNGSAWALVEMGDLPIQDVSGKLDAGGYSGNAKDLANRIEEVKGEIPDVDTKLEKGGYAGTAKDLSLEIEHVEKSIPNVSGKLDRGGYNGTAEGLNARLGSVESTVPSKLDKGGFIGSAKDLQNSIDLREVKSNRENTLSNSTSRYPSSYAVQQAINKKVSDVEFGGSISDGYDLTEVRGKIYYFATDGIYPIIGGNLEATAPLNIITYSEESWSVTPLDMSLEKDVVILPTPEESFNGFITKISVEAAGSHTLKVYHDLEIIVPIVSFTDYLMLNDINFQSTGILLFEGLPVDAVIKIYTN